MDVKVGRHVYADLQLSEDLAEAIVGVASGAGVAPPRCSPT
ncbi:hypothetical protein ACNKHU_27505 [Shigella flexneri]